MLQRYLPVWLLMLSASALWWPLVSTRFDPFLAFDHLHAQALSLIFAVAMFAIGTLLPPAEVSLLLARWPRVFLGTLAQYTIMPLLGWALAMLLDVSMGTKIGLILAGKLCPGRWPPTFSRCKRGGMSVIPSVSPPPRHCCPP